MQQVQVGNSAFPDDSKVWVVAPSRASLEQGSDAEDNTDASSTASTSSLVLSNLRIAPITASKSTLVSALKSNSEEKPKQRGLKKLMGRNKKKTKRVRFANATTPTAIPSLPTNHDDEQLLSHMERKRRTWYNGVEVRAFQAAADELALQADAQAAQDPTSWPARYQTLYEATVRNDDAATVKRLLAQAETLHESRDVAMLNHDDLIGMERLATNAVLLDSKRRRKQHQRSVLDTQNCAPYNNANRLRKAIVAASLKGSGPAQAWAACVAQMVALS